MSTSEESSFEYYKKIQHNLIKIEYNTPVSKKSVFGDQVWDFSDELNPRFNILSSCHFRIHWNRDENTLPLEIIRAIKILNYFAIKYPVFLAAKNKVSNNGGCKPKTYCKYANLLLRFLNHLYKNSFIKISVKEGDDVKYLSPINTIFDITLEDLQKATSTFESDYQGGIRLYLSYLSNPVVLEHICQGEKKQLQWNINDLHNINFKLKPNLNKKLNLQHVGEPIPDKIFRLMTMAATEDVLSFLYAIKIKSAEKYSQECFLKSKLASNPYFYDIFEEYKKIKQKQYNANSSIPIKYDFIKLERNNFNQNFSTSFGEVRKIINRVQLGAIYILFQFTGVRYSEAASFQVGCIQNIADDYVIRGTVIKGKELNSILDNDYWAAPPIVRDAVAVLEQISQTTKNINLVSSNQLTTGKIESRPLSGWAVNNMLTSYLYLADEKREFSFKKNNNSNVHLNVYPAYRITTHRLRHTLSLQMFRAGLGIPFISAHLKHVYNFFASVPFTDVTLGYGNIKKEIFRDVIAYDKAKREMHDAFYHPDSPIAGPGAKIIKQVRNQYFTGRMESSSDREILNGFDCLPPLTDVGLAFCGGRKEIELDNGSKIQPPCIGNAMCDPTLCSNATITKYHTSTWKKMYQENKKRLEDKELAHWHKASLKNMERAEKILIELGVDISTL